MFFKEVRSRLNPKLWTNRSFSNEKEVILDTEVSRRYDVKKNNLKNRIVVKELNLISGMSWYYLKTWLSK